VAYSIIGGGAAIALTRLTIEFGRGVIAFVERLSSYRVVPALPSARYRTYSNLANNPVDHVAAYGAMLDQCIGDRQHSGGVIGKQRASFGAGSIDITVDVANFPNDQRSDSARGLDIVTGVGQQLVAEQLFRLNAGQPSDNMRMRLLQFFVKHAQHQQRE
jgi:hypothetical protein